METRTNQADGSRSPEPGVEVVVDLGESDPTKAVVRQRAAAPTDAVRPERDDDDESAPLTRQDSRQWARRVNRMQRSFDQKLAERDAAHQRELTELRDQLNRVQTERKDTSAPDEAAHEREIQELQRQLEAAIEKGDSAAQARLTVEINRKETAYWNKKTAAQMGSEARREPAAGARASAPATGARPAAGAGPTAAGARFIKANEEWWDDPDYLVEKNAASVIFAQLRDEEGFDDKDDETFAEVAKRLQAKFPKLRVKGARRAARTDDDADDDSQQVATRRAPTGAVQDAGAGGGRQTRRRTLTQSDIRTMRMTGLDPDNDKHVMQYMREVQSYEDA